MSYLKSTAHTHNHTHCHSHHHPQPQPPTTKIINKNKPKIKSKTQTHPPSTTTGPSQKTIKQIPATTSPPQTIPIQNQITNPPPKTKSQTHQNMPKSEPKAWERDNHRLANRRQIGDEEAERAMFAMEANRRQIGDKEVEIDDDEQRLATNRDDEPRKREKRREKWERGKRDRNLKKSR